MTDTIAALYAALDEPDADVTHVLGLLADAYCDHCDEKREAACRWMMANGKRTDGMRGWYPGKKAVPITAQLPLNHTVAGRYADWFIPYQPISDLYCHAVDALADQWPEEVVDWWHALRTRGEEPVAGIAEEVTT